MLFTLVYAYLSYFIHWRRRRRKMKYLRLIRSLSRHSSISTIQGAMGSSGNSGDIYRPVFQHVHNGDALELVRESEGKVLVSPKTVVDLRGWTLYMGISPNSTIQGQELFVLCEAVPNRRITLRQVSIMKVTDYGTPLAWLSGPPFKFILQCEPDGLVSLMLGMIDGQLMVEDNLEITSVTTVSVKGSAHRLIQTHGPSLRSDTPHPTSSDTQGGRSLEGSNESLASVGRETDLEQELCRLSPSIDINIGAGEMNGLEIDGSPEVSAAGEAMAEFTETNIETNGFGAESDSHMVEEDDEEIGQDNRFSDKSKPPNVLIYCGKKDSARKFEGVRKIFKQCLHSERYVIYHLKHDQVHVTPWKEHCALLILASEKLYDGVDTAALDYFGSGGRILSFCSSLDQILLKRVKYQDSPMNVIQLDCGNKRNVTVISGRFCYELVDGKISTSDTVADAEVLGLAPEFDKPVIVRVRSKNEDSQSAGQVILSQVYLDKDPGEMGISTKIFSMLKQSNQDKFLILSSLLETLGMDCSRKSQPKLTAGVFLSSEQENVTTLMESLSGRIKTGIIRTPKKTLQFMGDFDDKYTVTEDMLPVFCNLGKSPLTLRYFRPQLFFQHLSTESLGQVVLYADVVPTTMTLLDGMMFSLTRDIGLVVIAGRQTSGRGRGGNAWISPPGCAMFSAHIRLDQASELGQKAAFLQHITAVAVVHCIRQLSGYQNVDLRVKWPNDIYYGKAMKLGGVIVSSTYMNGMIHAIVGCGFNVSNNNPTICINDVIQQHNAENDTSLEPFSTEELLGRVITTIEMLINEFQLNGQESFCSLYYKYWLHSGCRVSLESEGGQEVTIQGLDENGYLEVVTSEGTSLSLQPDGNTFDMLRNLIAIKHM